MVLRDWTYGRSKNVPWFMQDEDSLNDYIDERGEEMLRIHPEVDEKIDWSDPKNGRKRKKIGKSLGALPPCHPARCAPRLHQPSSPTKSTPTRRRFATRL